MRHTLILLALVLAGCGKGAGPAQQAATPLPPAPFADIAGAYSATVTSASGDIGVPYHANDASTFTISPSGTVTWDKGVPPVISYGQLSRGFGFTTQPWSIPNGEVEALSLPADCSTLKLESTRFGVLYGRVIFALVKTGAG